MCSVYNPWGEVGRGSETGSVRSIHTFHAVVDPQDILILRSQNGRIWI